MWDVEISDLSHLGGPMGTEYMISMGHKLFTTKEKAITWVEKEIIKHGHEPSKTLYTNEPDHKTWDCGYVGYSLRPIKVDE